MRQYSIVLLWQLKLRVRLAMRPCIDQVVVCLLERLDPEDVLDSRERNLLEDFACPDALILEEIICTEAL